LRPTNKGCATECCLECGVKLASAKGGRRFCSVAHRKKYTYRQESAFRRCMGPLRPAATEVDAYRAARLEALTARAAARRPLFPLSVSEVFPG
jgi:hypothetical protein